MSVAVLIATARLRAGKDAEFAAWKAHHDATIARFAGYVGSDMIPPSPQRDEWLIMLNFRTNEDAVAWQKSKERADILAEAVPLLEGGNLGEIVHPDAAGRQPESSVTEVIFSKVKAGMEDRYREWSARMQAEQAKYPGYRGMFLQPPETAGGLWTTIIRFETTTQLEAWMNAPERAAMLAESKAFIEHEQLTRLATSFPGWVPVDPMTGKGPPDWKTAMLVLLGLFPVVMLEMKFLHLTAHGVNSSLATFVGNSISVAATSFITMPLFVRWFGWWLFLDADTPRGTTAKGVIILLALFALEVAVLWRLLPW